MIQNKVSMVSEYGIQNLRSSTNQHKAITTKPRRFYMESCCTTALIKWWNPSLPHKIKVCTSKNQWTWNLLVKMKLSPESQYSNNTSTIELLTLTIETSNKCFPTGTYGNCHHNTRKGNHSILDAIFAIITDSHISLKFKNIRTKGNHYYPITN